MKLKLISLCLLFITIILSCKKDEPSSSITALTTSGNLLSQVITDNQPSSEYLYNSTNLISDEKSKIDLTLYKYNDKNQLVSTDYYANYNILSADLTIAASALSQTGWVTASSANKAGTVAYEYNSSDQLIKSTYTPSAGSSQYSEFSYDANNRVTMQSLYWDSKITGYVEYTYDGNGNLTKENLYNLSSAGVGELSTTTVYEFDNKQNPYKSVSKLMIPGINTNQNNIVKESLTIYVKSGQTSDDQSVTQNTYEYNDKGYPVSLNGNVKYVYK